MTSIFGVFTLYRSCVCSLVGNLFVNVVCDPLISSTIDDLASLSCTKHALWLLGLLLPFENHHPFFAINLLRLKGSITSKIRDPLGTSKYLYLFLLVFHFWCTNPLPDFYVSNWFMNQFSFLWMLKLLDSRITCQWDLEAP